MEDKKRPEPRGQTGPGKKQVRQKYFRQPHLNKPKRKNPPRYDRKFDREILQGFAEKYRGSLVGQLAAQQLRDISDQRRVDK